jgi:hypothetical protein
LVAARFSVPELAVADADPADADALPVALVVPPEVDEEGFSTTKATSAATAAAMSTVRISSRGRRERLGRLEPGGPPGPW